MMNTGMQCSVLAVYSVCFFLQWTLFIIISGICVFNSIYVSVLCASWQSFTYNL